MPSDRQPPKIPPCPAGMRKLFEYLLAQQRRYRPLGGIGMLLRESEEGTLHSALTTPGGPGGAAADDPDITFFLSDASTSDGDVVSNKVFVADGKINGEFPDGMGTSEYILDLADPADSLIYAAVTFDPTTLAITSRFLGVSGSGDFPESRVEDATHGFLYWLLGFTFFDADDAFRIVMKRVGDIEVIFSYGAVSGQPALIVFPDIGGLALP
jgi:hypothetical protein